VLQPPGYNNENYSQLTDKMFGTYKYIYKKYSNYDWYLKADDDTFIFMDNLKKFLRSKNSSIPINFGRNWNILVESGYESGGAGYVLSREAMMRLGEALDKNNTLCSNSEKFP
jgi:glycoprotein-N-acetylgalactosamine 3-beta-galactosyltransferase